MRHLIYRIPALLLVAAGALAAQPVYAHGFGERYDLPVPLGYYMIGAGATVALSFVVIGVFVRGAPGLFGYWRFNILGASPLSVLLQGRVFVFAVQAAAVFLFLLVIATGLFGDRSPSANFAPTFVWVIWWVGLGFFVALVGNLWALMNPWSILFAWAEALNRRLRPASDMDLGFEYPTRLGAWPAFALFSIFAWLENAYPSASDPLNIALLVLAYSAITWVGMLLFGRHVWLRHGECFSVVFGFLARFAPTEARVPHGDYCDYCEAVCGASQDDCVNCYACWERAGRGEREFNLRPWSVGLARRENVSTDILVFVILVLAAVTFDGFKATPLWLDIKVGLWDAWSALLGAGEFSSNARIAADSIGLVFFPVVFIAAYLFFSRLMALAAGDELSVSEIARAFVYSLVPIALAYNIAHFFTLLAVQGQLIIALASNPFGFGWDLFGTADYVVNIALVNARFAWVLSVVAIVLGHIIAVYLSHVIALRTLRDSRSAMRSQYPMLALMVMYTVISLWIVAQPIVGHG